MNPGWLSAAVVSMVVAAAETPNDFFRRGGPTFVVGTAGDDRADLATRVQAGLIRDMLFPTARVVADTEVDVLKGPPGWPKNPVVYGGPHVNLALAKLGNSLPFRLAEGRLELGGQSFVGREYRLIALVPARALGKDGPGYPEFVLYSGTGTPGVAEINAVRHGGEPILVADAFGRLRTGRWLTHGDGSVTAEFTGPAARRIAWRSVDRELQTQGTGRPVAVHVRFPKQLPAASDEEQVVLACLRGLETAARRVEARGGGDVFVYVYPDLGSIASLTGQRGDGHAVVEADTLHVVRYDPAHGGGFERLLAHEGTHVLAYQTWGAAGTPLLGEGLAVWAAGAYQGVGLDAWARRIRQPVPSVESLLGKSFRQLPEGLAYPLAGLFVQTAVEEVGLEGVRRHLYGASTTAWEAACKAAGTTPGALESAFRARFAGR